jgi:hypothetical protein
MAKVTVPGTLSVDDALAAVSSGVADTVVTPGREGTGTFLVRRGSATGAVVRVRPGEGGTRVTAVGVIPSLALRMAIFLPGTLLVVISLLGDDSARNAWLGLLGALIMFGGLGLMLRNTGGIARDASRALEAATPSAGPRPG